ncbi:MAG: class I SAM-dependent methyltransferase [Ferruginibacter sp.]
MKNDLLKDNFSTLATSYAMFRPVYPRELYDYIMHFVNEKQLAWDCGTGNGQAAAALSKYFTQVYASDISSKQIENARREINVIYAVEAAGNTSLPADSVDLVTVSQALHWFAGDEFYREVKRVTKSSAVIAAWTYGLLEIDSLTDEIIQDYHYQTLGTYWDDARKYVNNGYIDIPFPFAPIPSPPFNIRVNWNLQQLEGYLNTWSALQQFIQVNKFSPLKVLVKRIEKNWPRGEVRPVNFPLTLRLGNVH